MSQNLSIQERSVASLLKDNTNMVIPIYQRGYAWEAQQLDELWSDLLEVAEDKQSYHFFGQIVMNNSEGKLFIIDGQQRVTTSTIFVAVLRDKLLDITDKFNDSEANIRAKDMQNDLIGTRQPFHLTQSDDLNEYFTENILVRNTFDSKNKPKKGAARNVYDAYMNLSRKLDEALKEIKLPNERRDYVYDLYKAFTESFFVITLITPDEAAAFVIFETLNARGRDLNASDLLKNHILRTAKNDISSVKDSWDIMADDLGNDSTEMTKFIRAYWNANKQFVTEKSLYKVIYNEISTSNAALKLVKDLNQLAPVYEAVTNPKNAIFFENVEINSLLITLLDLGGKTFHPLVLALVKNDYSEADILTTLHKIYSFIVRNFTVGGLVANKYEKLFSNIAIKINTHEIMSIESVNEQITANYLSDDQFKDDFQYTKIKTEKASKHILKDIFYREEANKIDLDKVKVFILNKNIDDDNLIGNKVLVTKPEFSKMKNEDNILPILRNSKFNYTRLMANSRAISEKEVIEVQRNQSEFAAQYWQ